MVRNELYPAILDDGNTEAWFDMAESYMTKNASEQVSQWADRSGNDNHMTAAGGAGTEPTWSPDGVLFAGFPEYLATGAFTWEQPEMVYMVVKQITWNGGFICDGITTQGAGIWQKVATPAIVAHAGVESQPATDLLLGEWGIIRSLFNGVNGSLQVAKATKYEGNYGSNDGNGFTLGRVGGASSNFSNIEVKEIILRNVADTQEEQDAIYDYLNAKHSVEPTFPAGAYVEQSITVGATTNILQMLNLVMDSGANVFIDFGDGEVRKMPSSGVNPNWVSKKYPAAGTYTVKIGGELDKIKTFTTYCEGWNINVTEFEKTVNIENIGATENRVRTLTGRITNLTSLKEWWFSAPIIPNETGITGNIDSLSALEVLECQGYTANYPLANVTGTFSNIPNLKQYCVITKITGDMSTLTALESFQWGYAQGTVIDPQIQADESTPRIWGSMSNMTALYFFACNGGAATLTGVTTLLANMENFQYIPAAFTKPANLQAMPKLCNMIAPTSWTLNAIEVNQYLADIWANREVVRTYLKNTVGTTFGTGMRTIDLGTNNPANAAPTGQGITDKANLNSTVSPAVPGDGVTWTIITN